MKIRRVFDSVERNEVLEKSQQCLWSESGKPGLSYLIDQRQLSEDVIRKFNLGFIPHSVSHQLRGRIIIPLFDPSGMLVAIASRKIDDAESPLPVYWHEAYEKNFYLYGINNAIPSIRKWNFVNIVEGQFDVLQMHNHGITNAVGLCCTHLSTFQYAILNRYCEEMILILDNDQNRAGQEGVKKAINEMLIFAVGSLGLDRLSFQEYKHKVGYVEFPFTTDPDDFLRKNGSLKMRQLIKTQLHKLRNNDC